MTFLVTMLLVLAVSVQVRSSCDGQCNIVYCGGLGGPGPLNLRDGVLKFAEEVVLNCYYRYPRRCGAACNFGTVLYQNAVSDVCPMTPAVDFQAKRDCVEKASWTLQNGVSDNKLELCFQRLNNDAGLMATTDSSCAYKVVVLAYDQLTNSDIPTLKAQANKLGNKGATIHCYLVGTSTAYDAAYDEICEHVTRLNQPSDLDREGLGNALNCCSGEK